METIWCLPPRQPQAPAYPTLLFSESPLQIAPIEGFPDVSLLRALRPESSTLVCPMGWLSLLPKLYCQPRGQGLGPPHS